MSAMESPASHYLKSPQLWVKHPNGEYSILPNVHHTIPVIDHVDWRSSKRVPVLYDSEPCTGFKVHSIPDTCALIGYACNVLGFGLYRDGDKLDHDAFCASLMNEYLSKGESEDENHLPLV
jgi:hypothetical protein